MNLAQLLVRTAQVFADRPALYLGDQLVCDYRGLEQRVAHVGGYLRQRLHLQPGDRVGILMSNVPEYLEVLYGCWFGGLVVVPINAKLHPKEAEYILCDSGAAALFVSADLAPGMEPLLSGLPDLRAVLTPGTPEYSALYRAEALTQAAHSERDDLAWLFYTSGTTGRPKGVMLSHGNLLTMIACYIADIDMPQAQDSVIYAAPISHAAGMLNFPHVMAGAAHIVPVSAGFDPAELVELAAHRGKLSMFAAPTMVKRLVDYIEESGKGASGFKTILYGGGPMYLEDIRQALRVMGDCFAQIYGQGETPMTITALGRYHYRNTRHPRYEQRLASVGVAQSFVEVRVGDASGMPIAVGETGEVLVRGASVMMGYWNNPEATARAIRDGWLFTGDMGAMDEDGFLTLKDRSKDVIISGGSNIYPREVEEVLLQHKDVQEVSVVGRRDPEWGEVVVAFVVARRGAALHAKELDALCLCNIARFKRPKHYRFVEALPKSNYGKVLKTELRELLAAEAAAVPQKIQAVS
ncbi:MAG: AMP-dependent synthetase and ligase [Nevskia sp.]|nr:AMP-dependent synthetase and ligase [Nevskia sp.]